MNQPLRTRSAASLAVLASMIAGCAAPQAHVGAASHVSGKSDGEVGYATRALMALNSNNVPVAIDFAEKAVEKTPKSAELRALLGNCYFAAGRFKSAEAAFRDSLTLQPVQPQVVLKYALVQIAQGKNREAVALLNEARPILETSDYGLALALAGRPADAVAVLDPAARERGADATVRQNLALAHALAGEWEQARIIAAQDVPANLLDQRIDQWMQLATPKHASDQVAALVGVTPAAADAGQPVQLALNPTATRLADAAPVPQQETPVVEAAAVAPAPIAVAAVAPAPPPARVSMATVAATAVAEAKAVLASILPHGVVAAPKPAQKPQRAAQSAARRGNSPAVVQLGSYGSPERVLTAWNGAAHKFGALKAYAPMSAKFASQKGTFYRLSVRGFDSVGEASALCKSLRRQGGACFVRNSAGDVPVQIASR